MKIVHFVPFAPNACGMYEAARDMYVADLKAGHDVHMVDVGVTVNGKHKPGSVGKNDNRNGLNIITENQNVVLDADIIMAHTGVSDNWLVKCQAPMFWVMHGRPAACFKPEQFKNRSSYSLMAEIATWQRAKVLLSFWEYHRIFWKPIIPANKLVILPAPPIDGSRFRKNGKTHFFNAAKDGMYNIIMAESWREDVDCYEIVHGVIEAAKKQPGIKAHIYAMESPVPKCWEYLLSELRKYNALGEIWGRRPNMEEIYRAGDILLSPQRIVTRTVGEALCCGLPVIADEGNEFATWQANIREPDKLAELIIQAIKDLSTKRSEIWKKVEKTALSFSLTAYSLQMNDLYKKHALKRG